MATEAWTKSLDRKFDKLCQLLAAPSAMGRAGGGGGSSNVLIWEVASRPKAGGVPSEEAGATTQQAPLRQLTDSSLEDLVSLIPHFSREIFAIEGVAMTINYGLNKVRFPQPVLVDSRLRDTATLTEVTRSPKGTQLIIRHVIEIEGQERPACIAEMVSLLVE